jgi:hypothetical protein
MENSTMDLTERELLFNFFCKLPYVLRRTLPCRVIEEGYKGIVPFHAATLLNQCSSWSGFSQQTQTEILLGIDTLTLIAGRRHLLESDHDRARIPPSPPSGTKVEIEAMDTVTREMFKRLKRKKPNIDDLAPWRRRALWLNGSWVAAERKRETEEAEAEAARKWEKEQEEILEAERAPIRKEANKWLKGLLTQVYAIDKARVQEEKRLERERKKEELLAKTPKQQITAAMKVLFNSSCSICSTPYDNCSPADKKKWLGCRYCEYRWWCHIHFKEVTWIAAHEKACKDTK